MDPPADRHADAGDIEQRLRTMMHRRAAALRPRQPAWDRLAAGQREPVLLPSPSGSRPGGEASGRFVGRARPFAAAASVVLVVLAVAVVLERSGTRGSDGTDDEQVASVTSPPTLPPPATVPAPGSVEFDRYAALPVYPAGEDAPPEEPDDGLPDFTDPKAVVRAYLELAGVVEGVGPIKTLEVAPARDEGKGRPTPDELAGLSNLSMAWSTWGDEEGSPVITSGNVYLRRADRSLLGDRYPEGAWAVVGARTDGVVLKGVRRDDGTVSFVVSRENDRTGFSALRIEVNDQVVMDSEVAQTGPEPFEVTVPPAEVAVIRLQHLADDPLSITAMAVPVEAQSTRR